MRQKRAKVYRKAMYLYHRSFGFREPYQVLLDTTFVQAAVQFKMDIPHILHTVLQGQVKPMITQCCIEALYRMGNERQHIVEAAKLAERRKCNHRTPISPDECLKSVVVVSEEEPNKHRYLVATQNGALRQAFRQVPGVPMLYLKRSVLVLEPVNRATMDHIQAQERSKQNPLEAELSMLKEKAAATGAQDGKTAVSLLLQDGDLFQKAHDTQLTPVVRKKRAKGPNPLSVKKSKKAGIATESRPVSAAAKSGRGEGDPLTDHESVESKGTERKASRRARKRKKSTSKNSTNVETWP